MVKFGDLSRWERSDRITDAITPTLSHRERERASTAAMLQSSIRLSETPRNYAAAGGIREFNIRRRSGGRR
jgi:hypothetical protein